MANITNTLNVPVSDPITERLDLWLKAQKKRGRGRVSESLTRCMVGGYALHELGSGILAAWAEVAESGQLEGISTEERAQVLIRLLTAATGHTVEVSAPTPAPAPAAVTDKTEFNGMCG